MSPIAIQLEQAHNVPDNNIPLTKRKSVMLENIKDRAHSSHCSSITWHQPLTHAESCSISSLQRSIKLHGLAFCLPVRRNSSYPIPVPRVAVKVELLDLELEPPLHQLPQLPPHDPTSWHAPAADIRIDSAWHQADLASVLQHLVRLSNRLQTVVCVMILVIFRSLDPIQLIDRNGEQMIDVVFKTDS